MVISRSHKYCFIYFAVFSALNWALYFLTKLIKLVLENAAAIEMLAVKVFGEGMLRMDEGTTLNVPKQGSSALRMLSMDSSVRVDTTNILFVASGAYTGLDQIIATRLNKKAPPKLKQSERDSLLRNIDPCDLMQFGMLAVRSNLDFGLPFELILMEIAI